MISNLVSGLLGALTASLLTVIYLWVTEVRKLRGETFVEVASIFDEIWQLLQNIQSFNDMKYEYENNGYPNHEVFENVKQQSIKIKEDRHRLTELVNSTRVKAKLAYVYGDGKELGGYSELIILIRTIILDKFSLYKVPDWLVISREIHNSFSNEIDPKRARLERELMNNTRVSTIIKKLLKLV